ncbi:MAG TPA: preprotein translocase subunit SecE [Polyangiaceae bacterium]|jgi:preprotein translocase subunit SecE
MASHSDKDEPVSDELNESADGDEPSGSAYREPPEPPEPGVATALGVTRYVHAAFFAAGVLLAYLSGKALLLIWNNVAEWSYAARLVPQLLSYGDSERESRTLGAGAVIGLLVIAQIYRKEGIRSWAQEVANELAKVTWPNRETVSNGTIVVIVASAVATIYVTLLDRFWSFLTTLVYKV